MAIANSDGSIVLSTKIDTSGIFSEFKKIKSQGASSFDVTQQAIKRTNNEIQLLRSRLVNLTAEYQRAKQAGKDSQFELATFIRQNTEDINKLNLEVERLGLTPTESVKRLTDIIQKQEVELKKLNIEYASYLATNQANTAKAQALRGQIDNLTLAIQENKNSVDALNGTPTTFYDSIGAKIKSLISYFIGFRTVLAGIRFSGQAAEFDIQTEASVQRLVDIYGDASGAVGDFIDQNSKALGLSKSVGASIASTYGNLLSVWADQATNAELTNDLLNQTAVVASRTGRTTTDVAERIRSGLLGNTEAIEDLGINVNIKTIEITDAFKRIADGRSWEQLNAYEQAQVRTLAILEQSTNKYGTTVADTSTTIRNKFNAAYQDFQNSWGLIVNQVLLPVLQTLTEIFNIATAGLNALSGRSGKILEDAEANADASKETADNIKEQADNQKDLNDQMKKTLAGFDDIQILSAGTAKNTEPTEFDKIITKGNGNTNLDGSAYVDEASAMLTAIMGFVSVAMVAIGVILLLTGHIGWGLGFIIAGAGLLTVTQASVSQEGIGIDVQNALTTALLIAGVAAIVIGIILCMCQQYVKGIALIALGAATVVGDIAINWDSIKDMLSDEKVATWVAIGGTIAIVLGILLCFAQQWWAGIGLIALGATALGVDIAVNWDAITTAIKDFVVENAGIIALISAGLLIIGILVCFVNLPLGIALIAAGAVGLVTVTALNANSIVDWISGVWDAVKAFWNTYIAPVFTLKWWQNLAIDCGNGLIAGFEGAVNGIITLFEKMINLIVGGLNKISIELPDWGILGDLAGAKFGVDIKKADFSKVSIGRIPKLAQGTVIPPNREFLAVLGDQKKGTNIEAPLSTIEQAVENVLSRQGNNKVREEHYYLDEQRLMSVIYRLSKGGERISGSSLVDGGIY